MRHCPDGSSRSARLAASVTVLSEIRLPAAVADAKTDRVKSPSPDRLVVLAAAVTVLLWASSFVVIRYSGAEFSPGAMAFIRLSVGTVVLVVVAAIYRPPLPRGRGLLLVI